MGRIEKESASLLFLCDFATLRLCVSWQLLPISLRFLAAFAYKLVSWSGRKNAKAQSRKIAKEEKFKTLNTITPFFTASKDSEGVIAIS